MLDVKKTQVRLSEVSFKDKNSFKNMLFTHYKNETKNLNVSNKAQNTAT
jgi:hypothetical protein